MRHDDRHPDPGRAAKRDEIQRTLLADPEVAECAVVERAGIDGRPALVALVVPAKPLTRERWEHLGKLCEPDAALIPVSALPLTEDGALDSRAAASLEVLDDDVAKECERRLRALPGFERAVVVVESKRRISNRLHLSDLLPQSPRRGPTHPGHGSEGRPLGSRETDRTGRPAIAHGEALRPLEHAPQTLGDALALASKESPARGILYLDDDASTEIRTSYADLLDEASHIASGLHAFGVKRGERVIVLLDRNRDFVPAFWGCILAGAVPLPASLGADAHSPQSQVLGFWRALAEPLLLASASNVERATKIWLQAEAGSPQVLSLDDLRKHQRSDLPACDPDDAALLLATSGSTGTPKFVTHTHRTVLHLCAATAQKNAFIRDEISLNWFPLDHVGGLAMFHLRDVFLRCQQILGRIDVVLRDPLTWLEWIERYRATVTWAPNFAYALVTSRLSELASRRFDLSSMRFILNGGEAIVARQARRFLSLLGPHGLRPDAMHPAWGMSETCSGVTYSDRFSLETTSDDAAHVEVGEPIPGISLRIVGPNDEVLREGEIGALEVHGPSVTKGYHDNPDANAEAFTEDGWFRTGDLALLRDGRLTITGREKDVIIVNGVNFSCHAIESVVETVPGVAPSFAAAIGVRERGDTTDQLAVLFGRTSTTDEPLPSLVAKIRERVAHEAGIVPAHVVPIETAEFPKTAIGKIQRSKLRARFEQGAFAKVMKELDLAAGNSNTIPDWFYRRTWRAKQIFSSEPLPSGSHVLLFAGEDELGPALAARLEALGHRVSRVDAGADFARIGPGHYRVEMGDESHYRDLLASATAESGEIRAIVHLWMLDKPDAERMKESCFPRQMAVGPASALGLVRALAELRERGKEDSVAVCFVGRTPSVEGAPGGPLELRASATSVMPGLVETLSVKEPWLDARCVYLPVDAHGRNADALLAEIATCSPDRVVAHHGGRRFVRAFEKVDLLAEPVGANPFVSGGVYVLAGTRNAFASDLARHLLQKEGVRLLILDEPHEPPELTTNGSEESRRSEHAADRFRWLRAFEDAGVAARAEVDLAAPDKVAQAVAEALLRWGAPVDGVLDLSDAGEHDCPRDLAKALERRMIRSAILDGLVADRAGGVFVSMTPAPGLLGASSAVRSAAESAWLEAFSAYQRRERSYRSYALWWSLQNDAAAQAPFEPFEPSSTSAAVTSLLAVTSRQPTSCAIGLDAASAIAGRLLHPGAGLLQLTAYVPGGTPLSVNAASEVKVPDRFGTNTSCELHAAEPGHSETPARWDDEHELSAESAQSDDRGDGSHALRTRVRAIVADVLKLSPEALTAAEPLQSITPLDSLSLIEIVSALEEAFDIRIKGDELDENVSLEDLTNLVGATQR